MVPKKRYEKSNHVNQWYPNSDIHGTQGARLSIREAKTEKSLRNLEIKFERYDLIICDELGYVGFDKEGAEMLFNHLSLRTGKKSTIITTNLPFTRWEEVLKDKVLCSALVDRLCHKSYLVNMTGTSYRIKETKKYISNK